MELKRVGLVLAFLALAASSRILPAHAGEVTFLPRDGSVKLDSCDAHWIDESGNENRAFCGIRTPIPAGDLRVWLEGPDLMGEAPVILHRPEGSAGREPMVVRLATAPAGLVRLSSDVEIHDRTALELLHLDSHNRSGEPAHEMHRRLIGRDAYTGALMPEGPVLALLYDLDADEYVVAARPVTARAGAEVMAIPRRPELADVFVELKRPRPLTALDQYDVELSLSTLSGESHGPDVVIRATERLYALWYDVPGTNARLEVKSSSVYLPPQDVVLRAGAVQHLAAELQSLPVLTVYLDLPAELRQTELALTVEELSKRELLRRVEIDADEFEITLEAMPLGIVTVILESPPWKFRERVDLTDGIDASVTFNPSPIDFSGTVYHGESVAVALLELYVNLTAGKLRIETDEYGRFNTTLFRPGSYVVSVQLAGVTGSPLLEHLDVPNRATFEHDFVVGDISLRLRVVSAATGEGIDGASVAYGNERADGQESNQRLTTDSDGWIELNHLRQGTLGISVAAEGYVAYEGEPFAIEEGDDRELEVALTPVGERDRVRLVLFSGEPAGKAEMIAQASLSEGVPGWVGQADAQGRIEIPRRFDGFFLLARHPLAASDFRLWRATSGEETTWLLPEPAPETLGVFVHDSARNPVPSAYLVLWWKGQRVSGFALGWLTESRNGATDMGGFWRGRRLPRASVHLLAVTRDLFEQAKAGVLDGMAKEARYPWSEIVQLEIVD
jgi:hypothetical protein